MPRPCVRVPIVIVLVLLVNYTALAAPVSTTFVYQGRLIENDVPVNDVCDFKFALYDAALDGAQIGVIETHLAINVVEGAFEVSLDYGPVFTGEARWLEISVRCPAGAGAYTTLTPRQELTPTPYAIGLSLPHQSRILTPDTMFSLINDGRGSVGNFQIENPGSSAPALIATTIGNGPALYAATTDAGNTTPAIDATSAGDGGVAVRGVTTGGSNNVGVLGVGSGGAATGVRGEGAQNGVAGESTIGRGVFGFASAPAGPNYGVYGISNSANGTGVYGKAPRTGVFGETAVIDGDGVFGFANVGSGSSHGVRGLSESPDGYGVFGRNDFGTAGRFLSTNALNTKPALSSETTGNASAGEFRVDNVQSSKPALFATTNSGSADCIRAHIFTDNGGLSAAAVRGWNFSTNDNGFGVFGQHGGGGTGVFGSATRGYGVWGSATSPTAANYGVLGETYSPNGFGVYGKTTPVGTAPGGTAVFGLESESGNIGYFANPTYGAYAEHGASGNFAYLGGATYGAYAEHEFTGNYVRLASASTGVESWVFSAGPAMRGVANGHSSGHLGDFSAGVYGTGMNGAVAGRFDGTVDVNGTLVANAIGADDVEVVGILKVLGLKLFDIPHPTIPNTRLRHACIESSEVLNQYSGNVIIDSSGGAIVALPDWFDDINTDFRYQLTCIGAHAPVYVASEISNNTFTIGGGTPGMKVSWQVTARRNDAYLQANPFEPVVPADPSTP